MGSTPSWAIMAQEKCPECKGVLVERNNEIYCPKCGLVIEDEPIVFTEEKIINKEGEFVSRSGPLSKWADPQSGNGSYVGTWKEWNAWKKEKVRIMADVDQR